MKLMKELSEACGVPGAEGEIRAIIRRELKGKVDKFTEDAMGNLIAFKKGKAKKPRKIMFAAHMDEIGFYVRHIDDKGFLKIQAVGGFDTRNLFSRRVKVHASGKVYGGLIEPAGKPIHMSTPEERAKYLEVNDFIVDLGMKADKVKELVQIGDMVTLDAQFQKLGDLWCGKCMDDRSLVWVGIRALQEMKAPKNDIYGVFSVQEEVGLRGATTSAFGVSPDIGIALDVTLACDTPGVPDDLHISELGKGVSISVMNGAVISDRELVSEMVKLAKKHKIEHQLDILPRGGTDAGAIQRAGSGCRAITLSVPCRWVHTTTELIHPGDVKSTLKLVTKYLEA
ncbi:M20/M25/M40 family metallo-hydrolase [bacterium]|nr:M20/M25/M40 family metallo-hydrolase [bacterium]